jgi:hypothetical protein
VVIFIGFGGCFCRYFTVGIPYVEGPSGLDTKLRGLRVLILERPSGLDSCIRACRFFVVENIKSQAWYTLLKHNFPK